MTTGKTSVEFHSYIREGKNRAKPVIFTTLDKKTECGCVMRLVYSDDTGRAQYWPAVLCKGHRYLDTGLMNRDIDENFDPYHPWHWG